ncbi:MAG: hypothetical protein IAF94_04600 [Pirellulaceae bacterium]|nr:hypothetical protein [Pirellulaceae bacterium]
MTEPDVALTDFLLTAQCGAFSYSLSRIPARRCRLQSLCVQFFAAVGLASLIGGTVHGYFHEESTWQFQVLWRLGLLVLGAGSYFSWLIGAELLWRGAGRKHIGRLALAGLLLYSAYVLFWDQRFMFAILNYLPATFFLFLAFLLRIRSGDKRSALFGAASVLVTLVAAAIQQLEIALHPAYLNHNALYHLLQAVGLALLLVACRGLIMQEEKE